MSKTGLISRSAPPFPLTLAPGSAGILAGENATDNSPAGMPALPGRFMESDHGAAKLRVDWTGNRQAQPALAAGMSTMPPPEITDNQQLDRVPAISRRASVSRSQK